MLFRSRFGIYGPAFETYHLFEENCESRWGWQSSYSILFWCWMFWVRTRSWFRPWLIKTLNHKQLLRHRHMRLAQFWSWSRLSLKDSRKSGKQDRGKWIVLMCTEKNDCVKEYQLHREVTKLQAKCIYYQCIGIQNALSEWRFWNTEHSKIYAMFWTQISRNVHSIFKV